MPPTRTPKKPTSKPMASSSKLTLDNIPSIDVPETITPGYVYKPRKEVRRLDEDERARLIHELVGFHPRTLCHDIAEAARKEIYIILDAIENWARNAGGNNPKYETELNTGLVALETLIESHVDKAFDKFTAWVLRNAFEFSPELEVVMPWQKGLDFQRGEYVANQSKGQQILDDDLESMRIKVEQTRLLAQKLDLAEKKLNYKLNIAKQRKSEIGFIKEIIDQAGLNPLPKPTLQLIPILKSLSNSLKPLEPIYSLNNQNQKNIGIVTGENTKAWELGRSAYLNWAINKSLNSKQIELSENIIINTGGGVGGNSGISGSGDKLIEIENQIKQIVGNQIDSLENSEKILKNK
ncbi:uncharacterized protein I206_105798 [Kwoniella pini CBS 10737]|uniref:Kinetochore protein Mis12/MTW1 n=1 Tax=Kwoniella pini CBS 10737 TaxID=1296096 RepID=A0A1B9I0E9_9TREE|nr:uncharacterized protein I206_04618 [Kwoniella pini CBS 10737]OCF48931.1 hypothetical protein I206_04618 [Kwoniella pini CBS 10737]